MIDYKLGTDHIVRQRLNTVRLIDFVATAVVAMVVAVAAMVVAAVIDYILGSWLLCYLELFVDNIQLCLDMIVMY